MKKLLLLLLLSPFFSRAQPIPAIEEKTKNLKPFDGFMNFFWEEKTGKIWLEVSKFDEEVLYQPSLPAGLGSNDVGLDRGLLGRGAIVKFSRAGNKVLMIQPNYSYRATSTDAAEKRAVEQSFAQSVLWGFTIEAESAGSVLVDLTPFLLRDAMQVVSRLQNTKQGAYTIDPSRSAMYLPRTKNFPLNTEFESTITFTTRDARPGSYVSSVAPSPDAVTVRIHNSFVALPDSNYQPRAFDARSGFYGSSYYDYSTPVTEPIEKYFINRHRLQKKDPSAASGEPVKPIIYYLDNGTPEPIRSALLEGARWWNQAFTAAGYKNAFRVEILPDTADPMDLRYNMINWVHRSTRGWSYGYSVVDPRTGEILKGNVTLGSLRVRQDYMIAQGLLSPFEKGMPADNKMLKMALQRLKQLAAHEIGHTLGLLHNYIASTQNRASVMDYPSPNAVLTSNGEIDLSDAYTNEIGAWDKVAITYGYRDFPAGTDESTALNKILTDAASNGLTFISDRDARDPAGLHPTAHLWDAGEDPVASLKEILKIRGAALAKFGENTIRKGTPMAMLEDVLVPVYLFHRYQLEAVAKQVGGMNYTYALKGDGQQVTRQLTLAEQSAALEAVLTCIDPKTLILPENILKLIPPRPNEYEYNRELFGRKTGLAFDPLTAAEGAADFALSFLFNPSRLNRMVQYQALYNGLGADEMIETVLNKTWRSVPAGGMLSLIHQQNQQLVLTYLLSVAVSEEASFGTKAIVAKAIDEIKAMATAKMKLPGSNKGLYLLTLDRIENRYDAKPYVAEKMPPGAPIGCEDAF